MSATRCFDKLALGCAAVWLALAMNSALAAEVDLTRKIGFDIPAQPLSTALIEFSRQARLQVMSSGVDLARQRSPGINGRHSIRQALNQLLSGSGLRFSSTGPNTIAVLATEAPEPQEMTRDVRELQLSQARHMRLAENSGVSATEQPAEQQGVAEEGNKGIPEILVKGSRTLNTDIQRTEDDVQPYVVIDREQIERSMSTNVEELLKTRLPMNAIQRTSSQLAGSQLGNQGAVSLRGLGPNQTLILVDGRRMPSVNTGERFVQPDINGIPLSSIERIEILPSTASGIYGGGATGGVINIITRKDYAGLDLGATYGNTFDTDSGVRRIDLSTGLGLEGGRTQVLFSASHSTSNPLLTRDRDLARRARERQFQNNPAVFYTSTTPPHGYTSNIHSQDGSNLVLDSGAALGFPNTYVPVGYAGPASDNGAALAANAGRYNLDLPEDQLGGRRSLLSNPTVTSATLSLRRDLGSRVEAYADVSSLSNEGRSLWTGPNTLALPADAPGNPFSNPINISFPATTLNFRSRSTSETVRATGGLIVRLPRAWTASLDYVWSRSRHESSTTNPAVGDPDGPAGGGQSVTTAFTNGILDPLRDLNAFPLDYSAYLLPSPNSIYGPADLFLENLGVRLSGPLFELPAGSVTLSSLVEQRTEEADDTFQDTLNANAVGSATYYPGRSQDVNSYYLEARVPLFSAANALGLVRELELQASVRHDEYETASPSINSTTVASRMGPLPSVSYSDSQIEATKYTVGVRFAPMQGLVLRASFGSGFLPASIEQLVPPPAPFPILLPAIDPKRGGNLSFVGPFALTFGGNPDLMPEESESWSAGAILTPPALPGLRLSLDYTRIEKSNEITTLFIQPTLDLEDYLPGRITRLPLTPAEEALGYTGGVITAMDVSFVNVSVSRLEAYDIQADYRLETAGHGDIHFYALATWQPELERRAVPTAPYVNEAGYTSGPLKLRGNAGLVWDRGQWTLGWNMQFFDDYRAYTATLAPSSIPGAILNQGAARIPSQHYHDVHASYRFDDAASWMNDLLKNAELRVGVQNLFDAAPPLVATVNPYEGYSTYADPRLRRYTITLRARF